MRNSRPTRKGVKCAVGLRVRPTDTAAGRMATQDLLYCDDPFPDYDTKSVCLSFANG